MDQKMKELLAKINLRRLPEGPIGFVPIIAEGASLDQTARPILFRILKLQDPYGKSDSKKAVIEVMETPEEAQILLEVHLSRCVLPGCKAIGMVRPFFLHELFEALQHFQVVIPMQQSDSVKKIFRYVELFPWITYYKLDHWRNRELGRKECQKFEVLHHQLKAIPQVAAFLRKHSR